MKKSTGIIWGLGLVIVGICLALRAFGADIQIIFPGWWTLFIIIPSLASLCRGSDVTSSFIWLMIGVALLLCANGVLNYNLIWKLLVPFVVIVIGLSILFKAILGPKMVKYNKNSLPEYWAIFGTQNPNLDEEEFTGANVNAIFGEAILDLSEAKIKDEAVICADSIFGSTVIRIPDDIKVVSKVTPIFGDFKDRRKIKTKEKNQKTVYVTGYALFGGIEIK